MNRYIQFYGNNIDEVLKYVKNNVKLDYYNIKYSCYDNAEEIILNYRHKRKDCIINFDRLYVFVNDIITYDANIDKIVKITETEAKRLDFIYNFNIDYNDTNYFIDASGVIVEHKESDIELYQRELLENYNYFNNFDIAKYINQHQKLQRKLLIFSMLNDGDKIDWNNKNTEKYYILCYKHENTTQYKIEKCTEMQNLSMVYFYSKEIAKEALEVFKDDINLVYNL